MVKRWSTAWFWWCCNSQGDRILPSRWWGCCLWGAGTKQQLCCHLQKNISRWGRFFKYFFFHPKNWGKIPILTIFLRWVVQPTTSKNQIFLWVASFSCQWCALRSRNWIFVQSVHAKSEGCTTGWGGHWTGKPLGATMNLWKTSLATQNEGLLWVFLADETEDLFQVGVQLKQLLFTQFACRISSNFLG